MRQPKTVTLQTGHTTQAQRAERRAAELSLTPVSELPDRPPQLAGHTYAQAVYARLMALYAEVIAEVVTAFDLDVLCDYCLATEESFELRALREDIVKRLKTKPRGKRSAEANGDLAYLAEKLLAVDARLDLKREKAHKLRESLYLTPRARAGAPPPLKPAEPEKDEMEALLDEAQEIVRR